MNFANFLQSLVRHRVLLAIGLVLAVVAGAVGWVTVPSVYRSTAILVVLPPGSGASDAMLNPVINLNGNLAQLAMVIGTALQTDSGKQVALDAGGSGRFTVNSTFSANPSSAELVPQLTIVADGGSPQAARAGADALAADCAAILSKLQADASVPSGYTAYLLPSVKPQLGKLAPQSPARRAGSFGLVAVLGIIAFVSLLDGWQERRRRRAELRRRRSSAAEPDGNGSPISSELSSGLSSQPRAPANATRHRAQFPTSTGDLNSPEARLAESFRVARSRGTTQ